MANEFTQLDWIKPVDYRLGMGIFSWLILSLFVGSASQGAVLRAIPQATPLYELQRQDVLVFIQGLKIKLEAGDLRTLGREVEIESHFEKGKLTLVYAPCGPPVTQASRQASGQKRALRSNYSLAQESRYFISEITLEAVGDEIVQLTLSLGALRISAGSNQPWRLREVRFQLKRPSSFGPGASLPFNPTVTDLGVLVGSPIRFERAESAN